MKFESFSQPMLPEEKVKGIPFVITRAMKQQLADLGWAAERRNQFTPEQAHSIINNQKTYEEQKTNEQETLNIEQKKPEALITEQTKNSKDEAPSPSEEINSLTESIENTQAKIRGKLSLPPTDEDPPSILSLRERLEKLKGGQGKGFFIQSERIYKIQVEALAIIGGKCQTQHSRLIFSSGEFLKFKTPSRNPSRIPPQTPPPRGLCV